MSPPEIPDRRPLLYIVMGGVIAAIAIVLFWPHGEDAPPPNLVLTPESVRQASDIATDVEGVADLPEAEQAQVPGESFPVTDATLPKDLEETPPPSPAKTAKPTPPPVAKPAAQPTPTRLDPAQPSSRGDYVIYVGSYRERANAQRATRQLADEGIQAQVLDANGKYRVAVGYFPSSAQAEAYAKTFASRLGLEYWVGRGR